MNLKQMFDSGKLVRIADACNAMTGQLVEQAEFEGVWFSSLVNSVYAGTTDTEIISVDRMAKSIEDIAKRVEIPIVVDCDTGRGSPDHAAEMVKAFQHAGAQAVCFEDKVFPKDNSLLEGGRQRLEEIPKFVEKLLACKEARKSKDFLIFARVEALIAKWGQEEALKRAKAYAEVADAIFIHSKSKKPDEIMDFVRNWNGDKPLILCPTTYWGNPLEIQLNINKIHEQYPKVAMVIFANYCMRAQITATKKALLTMEVNNSPTHIEQDIADLNEVFELNGTFSRKEKEKTRLDILKAMGYEI